MDIPSSVNISYDVIIFSKTNEEHDHILKLLLELFRGRNLTLNKDKCLFHQESIKFFEYILTSKGIQVHDCKVRTIVEAKRPSNQTEVKSFLGLASYCSRFINNFATITKPLRRRMQDLFGTIVMKIHFNKSKDLYLTRKPWDILTALNLLNLLSMQVP